MKLLLLPGMDGTGKLFEPLLRVLPAELEPIVVSYPNRIQTWQELQRKVEEVSPSEAPYVVLAESFSGPVALRIGVHAMNKPRAIVLCASFCQNPVSRHAVLCELAIKLGLLTLQAPEFVVRTLLLGDNASSEVINRFYEAVRSVDSKVLASRARMILNLNVETELTTCDVPILYVRATKDRLVSSETVEVMKELNPKMQVAEVEGPHFIVQRAPYQLVDALSSFLRKL